MSRRSERIPPEEHHTLQLEEDHRIDADAGPTALGIQLACPLADEGQVEFGLQMPVEVAGRDEFLQRDGDRLVEAARFGAAERRGLRGECQRGNGAQSIPRAVAGRPFSALGTIVGTTGGT